MTTCADPRSRHGATIRRQPAAAATRARHVLWAASVLGGLAQSLAGAAGSLLAGDVGGSDSVAGLPQTMLVAGAALAALGLSGLASRRDRRAALSAGAGAGVAGCLVVAVAAASVSLPLVLAGCVLLGAGNTAVMLGRYAAADLVTQDRRSRAMASVLAATTAGAVAGPNLLAPAGRLATWLGIPPMGGPYLIAAMGFAAAMLTLAIGLRLPASVAADGSARPEDAAVAAAMPATGAAGMPTTGPAAVRAAPVVFNRDRVVGLATLALASLVMIGVMTMAPVQMHHMGSGLGAIGLVVSLHILGMFAPSPLSGRLTDRFGGRRVAAGAAVVLVTATELASAAVNNPEVLAVAMLLLGVGWNLALISGSALLTNDVPIQQRPRLEGWGEVGIGVAAASGGALSGPIMQTGGYSSLAFSGAIVAALILPVAWSGRLRLASAIRQRNVAIGVEPVVNPADRLSCPPGSHPIQAGSGEFDQGA